MDNDVIHAKIESLERRIDRVIAKTVIKAMLECWDKNVGILEFWENIDKPLLIGKSGVSKLRDNKELVMTYLQVKDLKKTRELWGRLERDRELVITKDGQPRAIMISVEPEDLESSLVEIRRALFSAAVGRVRRRAVTLPPAEDDIAQAIEESRRDFR